MTESLALTLLASASSICHSSRSASSRAGVPLFLQTLGRHEGAGRRQVSGLAQAGDLSLQALGIEDFVALLVDDLALVVGDVVVFRSSCLRMSKLRASTLRWRLDGTRDDAGLDGLAGHLHGGP